MKQRLITGEKPRSLNLADWILLSSVFSILLVLVRIIFTGQLHYLFLCWNLFLAAIPYLITEWLSMRISLVEQRWKLGLITLCWLLFIPNTFYILTDLFHLSELDNAPRWYDLLLIFSFAWNGLLLGVLSIRRMELLWKLSSGNRYSILLISVVMWLNAFGIYIGRYLRYNSWDIITQPFSLVGELISMFIHPFKFRMEWGMVTVYALFILVLYETMKKVGQQFQQSPQ